MSADLPFTGERFTPECVREISYEHWHRYAFALSLAVGKRVLDAACGEGYGSAMLGRSAQSVLGVDIDPASIKHAQDRYGSIPELAFRLDDVTALDALPDAAFDLITCFETLEHVESQDALLAGFARMLAPGGILLVSSPDKAEYSDRRGFHNPFHVRELYRDELEALLSRHFAHTRLFAQKLLFQSVLWALDTPNPCIAAATTHGHDRVEAGLGYPPMYYLAVCAQHDLPRLPGLHLFGDADESVYNHYNDEIRKGIRAGERIAEMEQRLVDLQRQPAATRSWWLRMFGR